MDKSDSERDEKAANQKPLPSEKFLHKHQEQAAQAEPAKQNACDELYDWEDPSSKRIRKWCIQCRAGWRRTQFHGKCTVVLTLVGLIVLIIYAIATIGLYSASQRQVRALQQQSCIQQESSTNAERAWVGLAETSRVHVSPLDRKQFTAAIKLVLKNFGKGPALNVYGTSGLSTHGYVQADITIACDQILPFVGLKPSTPIFYSRDISKIKMGVLLFPGVPLFTGTTWGGNSLDILGQEVFVVGCIVYKDQFQQAHWTKFSYSTGSLLAQVVRDASAFHHLYASAANNYTDDVKRKSTCSEK